MDITELTIESIDESDLRPYVSIVWDGCFAVHELRIIRQPEGGLLIAMPSRNAGGGVFADIAFPIDARTRTWIEARIPSKYAKILTADRPRKKRRKQIH
jgi:DNA-binding cell septation regulator SpoVG